MATPKPQESTESKYVGHHMLFTLENQHSHTKNVKIIWKKTYEANALSTESRAIKYTFGTVAGKSKNAKYPIWWNSNMICMWCP